MTRIPYNSQADNAGRIPQVGDYVAYNMSGQIATGYITHMDKWRRNITIKQVLPDDEHTSRIRGGVKCVLVLQEAAE